MDDRDFKPAPATSALDIDKILDHSRVSNGDDVYNDVYILRPDSQLVAVFSQQVRALNLVRAIYHKRKFNRRKLAVIGGGAAGLTAAAAAALAGAEVTLFERSRDLMPLQMGCATRALHPHVHQWPDDRAFRAVSHLPILSWTAGTAHEVAREIVGKFNEIRDAFPDRIKIEHKHAKVQPAKDESPLVFREGAEKGIYFQLAIIAVGLGIEDTKNHLPLASYWRVDPLGQPILGRTTQRVLISGAGDGALIDILRAMIKDFDHGTFYDDVVQKLRPVQNGIEKVEEAAWKAYKKAYDESPAQTPHEKKRKKALVEVEHVLTEGYTRLNSKIQGCLDPLGQENRKIINPDVQLYWRSRSCEYEITAFPLNRLLVWWVRDYIKRGNSQSSVSWMKGKIKNIEVLDQEQLDKARYSVEIDCEVNKEEFDHVVVRHGATPLLSKAFEGDESQIKSWVCSSPPKYPDSRQELIPWLHWDDSQDEFKRKVTKAVADIRKSCSPRKIVAKFYRDENGKIVINKGVYRISLELKGNLEHLRWVTYDLHPERNRLERKSAQPPFTQWVNSSGDYRIRARLSDGSEVDDWLGGALRRGEGIATDGHAVKAIEKLESAPLGTMH